MEHPIIITSHGKIIQNTIKRFQMRRNLPYQGIARRALMLESLEDIIYDRDIDVDAMLVK